MGAQGSIKVQTLFLDEAAELFFKIYFEGQGIP